MSEPTEEKVNLQVDSERIHLLAKQGLSALITSLFVSFLLASTVLINALDTALLATWSVTVIIITIFRILLIIKIKNQLTKSNMLLTRKQVSDYEIKYSIGGFLSGLTFGILSFSIDPSWSLGAQFIIPFVLIGISAGAISSNSSSLPAYYSFITPALLPLMFVLDELDIEMATVFLIIHFVFMVLVVKRFNHSLVSGLRLGFKNADLVTDLKASNNEQAFLISQNEMHQKTLESMAHYDVLTGLPNRALFADRFHQAVSHSKRTKTQLAVCFLDLDNFKPVNDNYGHDVGDALLLEVAQRITANIREEDTVSRQGGDEFTLLLNEIESYDQCRQTLERIHHSLAQPFLIDNYSHKITASSGISIFPQDNSDIDTLLRHADQAMYQAKLAGKNNYHLFNPEHDQRTIQKHHQLVEIEHALTNNEFQLYYQPKVNMVSGEVYGAEALIRWIHPENGLIPPLDFLPSIEGTELEIKLGDWVINEALHQLEVWRKQDIKLEVSVNISSHHILSDSFLSLLEQALSKHSSVNSKCLQLEILESSVLSDLNAISSIITTCQKTLGVNIALDDFGTGYSSLTHLRNLPANTIKIDQSFIRDMLDAPSDSAIIDGVIGLADSFNREVIAEGVETTEHGLMLILMGCDHAQGYGIAKPMPATEFPKWLSQYIPNQEWLLTGNKNLSLKETKAKTFLLASQQWKNKFTEIIHNEPKSSELWPIMNHKKCPCGTWIIRAKQEHFFDQVGLKKLEQTHNDIHSIAATLQSQYQANNIDAAREGVTQLQLAFADMEHALDICE